MRSNKLVSLHIDEPIKAPINGFKQLQELFINNANYNKLYNVTMGQQSLEHVLVELLNQNTLQFISIEIDQDIECVRNVIKKRWVWQNGTEWE